jgi:hypothetical protein
VLGRWSQASVSGNGHRVPGFGASLVSAAPGVGIELATAPPMQHENTRIHGKALELIRIAAKVIRSVPPGHGDLLNQLRRASSSVALNSRPRCAGRE